MNSECFVVLGEGKGAALWMCTNKIGLCQWGNFPYITSNAKDMNPTGQLSTTSGKR